MIDPQQSRNWGHRIARAVVLLLVVAIGARVVYELLAPFVPGLVAAAVLIGLILFIWHRRT